MVIHMGRKVVTYNMDVGNRTVNMTSVGVGTVKKLTVYVVRTV